MDSTVIKTDAYLHQIQLMFLFHVMLLAHANQDLNASITDAKRKLTIPAIGSTTAEMDSTASKTDVLKMSPMLVTQDISAQKDSIASITDAEKMELIMELSIGVEMD